MGAGRQPHWHFGPKAGLPPTATPMPMPTPAKAPAPTPIDTHFWADRPKRQKSMAHHGHSIASLPLFGRVSLAYSALIDCLA